MDKTKLDALSSAWTVTRRSFVVHEGVVMGIPNFSTIALLFLVGEGKADNIYDRMMSLTYPKGANVVLNKMNDLKNKSSQNL